LAQQNWTTDDLEARIGADRLDTIMARAAKISGSVMRAAASSIQKVQ
jgi:hypothetical protein